MGPPKPSPATLTATPSGRLLRRAREVAASAWRRNRGTALRLLPTLLTVALVGRMLLAIHATFLRPAAPMNMQDEGYVTAFAARMLEGRFLPYVDAVSHRGPVLYVVAALAVAVGGRDSFVPIRALSFVCSVLVVVLAYVAALRARRPLAGALAAVGVFVVCGLEMSPHDGLAYNGEVLLDVFALGALVCLVSGLGRGPEPEAAPSRHLPLWTAAAGVLASLGALSKQVGVVDVLSLSLWPLAAAVARRRETG